MRIIAIVILSITFGLCNAQNKKAYRIEKKSIHSENYVRDKTNTEISDSIVLDYSVSIPNAVWLRLIFSDYYLGDQSYLMIKSLKDGSTQIHNQKTLIDWRKKSAAFNGGDVEIKLVVKGGAKNVFFNIDSVIVGETGQSTFGIESLCGADNRVASNDVRVGRLPLIRESLFGWCTVWLVSNGAILSAGHCVDYNPFPGGDGTLDLLAGDFIEFNVPASQANGAINLAAAQDQYPIDINNCVIPNGWQQGADWAVLRCLPNANTGLLPHQAQGDFYRMTRESPQVNNNVRITGFGVDDTPQGPGPAAPDGSLYNADNATQQTNAGAYVGETSNGARFLHRYSVDTEPANSGSPIIWEANNNFTIGIHTNGGCTASGGSNSGTSFEHDPLENALQNFHGGNSIYVDVLSLSPNENGSIFSPFNTVQEGVNSTPNGGRLYITTGTYNGNSNLNINREITILPPSTGTIVINP